MIKDKYKIILIKENHFEMKQYSFSLIKLFSAVSFFIFFIVINLYFFSDTTFTVRDVQNIGIPCKSFDLEKTLSDLEQIVEELEDGQLSLEDAMKRFEEGVKLTRICQKTLK